MAKTRTGARTRSTAKRAGRSAKQSSQRLADRIQARLPDPLERVVERARGDDILLFSAGLAFYALISVVPLAIFCLWVVSLLLGDDRVREIAQQISRSAPEGLRAGQFFQRVAELGVSLGVPALVTGLWPATSYGAGLRRAFERLSKRDKKELKGLRGRGLVLIVLLPVFVVGTLVASFAGTVFLGESAALQAVGYVAALATGSLAAALSVALIYRIFPADRLGARSIWRGTLFAATSISLLSVLFTLFLNLGANAEEHFATSGMATIVLAGLWLFLANALLLVGFKIAQET
jgi:membrane protein